MANTSTLKVGVKVPVGVEGEGGPEPHLPPWPEWSDAFIKTVSWTGTKPPKKSFNGSYSTTSRRSRVRSIAESDHTEKEMLYEDPAGLVKIPEDIPVTSWIRPHHTSMSPSFVLEPDVLPLDLLTHNRHLMEYKIMRTIMGSVACVEREAFHRPFPVEFQSSQFAAPGGSLWRPWHHVYCIGPQIYNLQYNKAGKYLVRLFYLGKWRRLTVDDLLPFDSEGRLLLPTTRPDNLWLPILSKALLRIAALSNGADFSVVHCLTAWLPSSLLCKGYSQYQLWCVCCQLMATTDDITHSLGCCCSQQSISCPPDASVENLDAVNSRVIFGMVLNPTRTVSPAMSISSIESMVLLSNVRYNSERPSPQWKEYRWKEWAFNNGIISDISSMPFRNVQIYNPLGLSELLSPAENDKLDWIGKDYWLDFEVFLSVTRVLQVYYKPSYFKYSLRAWSLSELTQKTHCAEDVVRKVRNTVKGMDGKGDAGGKSKSKSPKADKTKKSATVVTPKSPETEKTKGGKGKTAKDKRVSFVEWPLNLNTPSFFYLLVDSMFCKQMYICLSAFNPDEPTYAHIYTGKFEWYSPTVAPLVFMLTTSATAGYTLALSPGLHVFRVWYQFPVHFCLQIFSNTMFTLGSKMYIQQMLSSYSESFQFYGEKISSSFDQLLRAVEGGAEHGSAYNQLMASLHPPQLREQLVWPQWFNGHTELLQAFEESLTEMLAESTQFPSEMYQVLLSFQLLFLNPVFGEQTLLKVRSEYYDYVQQRRWSKRQREVLLEEELKQMLAQAGDAKGKKSPKSDKTGKPTKESPRKGSVKSAKTGKTGKQK